jgi:hypothetical protein
VLRIYLLALTYILFLLGSAIAEASDIIEVDMGACWVQQLTQEMGGPGWKVASFNDDRNFVLRDGQLLESAEPSLKKMFAHYPQSQYRADLYCGGGGHQLLVSIYDGPSPVCVWLKRTADGNSAFVVQDVFPNPHRSSLSACFGVNPGMLLLGLTDEADAKAVRLYLRLHYPKVVRSSQFYPHTHVLSVRLWARQNFHESEVRDALMKDTFLASKMRFIEYDDRVLIVGSELGLESGTYPGY